MVKKNKNEFNDLIAYRKIGYGKLSLVDYSFIIDKDYNARVEIGLDRESKSRKGYSKSVNLDDFERTLTDKLISRFVSPKIKNTPFVEDDLDYFEKEEIYFGDTIIENDEELNNRFGALMHFIESEHEEISAENIAKMYDNLNENFSNKII